MTRQTLTQQHTPTTSPLSTGGILQRKCASCGQHTATGGECTECSKKKPVLQRRAASQGEVEEVPAIVHEVLQAPGQLLDTNTRHFAESQMGHDFSKVRVHTDNQANQSALRNSSISAQGRIQRYSEQLVIGSPNDRYEQEADRVAAQVMRMSIPPDHSPQVQRFGEEDNPVQRWSLAQSIAPVVQRQVDEQVQMRSLVQRAFQAGGNEASGDLESRLNASKGGGSALAPEVRAFMEPRFGADFSSVRVHTGGEAVQMNRELGAQAFTYGSDVYYGGGKTPGNDDLTAHELTHVIQQTGGTVQRQSGDNVMQQRSAALQMRSQLRTSALSKLMIQRVTTSGGEWQTDQYDLKRDQDDQGNPTPAALGMRGLDIKIKFTPGNTVDAELIGLTQTVNSTRNNTPHYLTPTTQGRSIASRDAIAVGKVTTSAITGVYPAGFTGPPLQIPGGTRVEIIRNATPPSTNGQIRVVDGVFTGNTLEVTPTDMAHIRDETDEGAHIDMDSTNTNPMYAVSSPNSASLDDPNTGATWGQHGWHYRVSGSPRDQEAILIDKPRLRQVDRNSSQIFETTALATKGSQAGTYYGSVRWGWRTDDAGNFTKVPFEKVSDGVPSSTFMKSAELWNASKTSTGADTLDLPTVDVKVTTAPITGVYPSGFAGPPLQIPTGTRVRIIQNATPPSTNGRIRVVDGTFTGNTLEVTPANMANLRDERP